MILKKTRIEDYLRSHSYVAGFSIFLLALLLRILALLSLKETIYFDHLLWDEKLYHDWAQKIVGGTYHSNEVYEFAPLPAYFIALLYKLFSPEVLYIRIVNILFGSLTCTLVYLIGKSLSSHILGLLSGLIAAAYSPFIFYSIVPLKTAFSVLLFSLVILSLIYSRKKPSLPVSMVMGISLGLLNNVRPNMLVLVFLLPLLICWFAFDKGFNKRRSLVNIVMFFLGLGLVQAPFIVRNKIQAGKASPTTSQLGMHLYLCNQFQTKTGIQFATNNPSERGIQFTIEASRRAGRKLTSSEADQFWKDEFFNTVKQHPDKVVLRFFRRIGQFLNRFERGDHYHIGFLSQFAKFFQLPLFQFWLVLPLGLAGLICFSFRQKEALALLLVFIAYASTLILFFTSARMRLPLLVILIPYAVMGIHEVFVKVKERCIKPVAIYSCLVFLLSGVVFLPRNDPGELTAYYNTHALILNKLGREQEAIEYWDRSSKTNDNYADFANLSLAKKYYEKGDTKKVMRYLNRVKDTSYAAARKYEMLGDIYLLAGKLSYAATAYEKSLNFNSGFRLVRQKLVKAYQGFDKQKAKQEQARLMYINFFY